MHRIKIASWSEWSSWGNYTFNGVCPGYQERTRQCLNPWSILASCDEKTNDSQTCDEDKCRELFLIHKFGCGRDLSLGIWKWTNAYTNFPRKKDYYYICPGSVPNFDQNYLNSSNFRQFWLKFERSFENRPTHIRYKKSFMYPVAQVILLTKWHISVVTFEWQGNQKAKFEYAECIEGFHVTSFLGYCLKIGHFVCLLFSYTNACKGKLTWTPNRVRIGCLSHLENPVLKFFHAFRVMRKLLMNARTRVALTDSISRRVLFFG